MGGGDVGGAGRVGGGAALPLPPVAVVVVAASGIRAIEKRQL